MTAQAAAARKARGAFFTPPEITDWLCAWAIRTPADAVLEPSCGEAAFLLSALERLRALGAATVPPRQLAGVDVFAASIDVAERRLAERGARGRLHAGNFFDQAPRPRFDAVLGNPPYVRYQSFSGRDRALAAAAALAQGVRLSGLASSWAAFVVHAAAFLKPAGRLALVLPAELLSVGYAAPVREFLLRRFARVRLVLFEQRVFPEVLEEVVLLLAEGQGPADGCELVQATRIGALAEVEPVRWRPADAAAKWTPALLPPAAAEVYSEVVGAEGFCRLAEWGTVQLGMVTGNNGFFALSQHQAQDLGLPLTELLPISPPGSRHLRGLRFTEEAWQKSAAVGKRILLFAPMTLPPSAAAQRYLAAGEARGVHEAFKCRVRSPWWRLPQVPVPDLFLTYMNHEAPRLVANRARVLHLNSVHGIDLRRELRSLGRDLLPLAALNSVTLLGAELVGRAYGGGLLKLEPREAAQLPLPSPASLRAAAVPLRALLRKVARCLSAGDLRAAMALVDEVLLGGQLGLDPGRRELLRQAREELFGRRAARGQGLSGSSGGG